MNTCSPAESMTVAEAQAFVAKTQRWWEQLTAKEQAHFHQFIQKTGDAEVQGYGDFEYAMYQLLFVGNAVPALSMAVNIFTPSAPPARPVSGGVPGGGPRPPLRQN